MKNITKDNAQIFFDIFSQWMTALGAKAVNDYSHESHQHKEWKLKDVFPGKHLYFSITNDDVISFFVAANWKDSWYSCYNKPYSKHPDNEKLGTHWKNNFYPNSVDPFDALLETAEYYNRRYNIGQEWLNGDQGEIERVIFRQNKEDGECVVIFPDREKNNVYVENQGFVDGDYSTTMKLTKRDDNNTLMVKLNRLGYILKPIKRK